MCKITSDNYIENVLRTESVDFDSIKERLSDENTIRLLHSSLGMVTEASEFADMLKKHIFYGKDLDLVNAKEEVGDQMWYIGVAIDVLNETLDDIMSVNIEKLKKRYPEKFNENNALNRNLEEERNILET